MSGSSKASQFWDADAPFASASLVEMQKSPGLEGPLVFSFSNSALVRKVNKKMWLIFAFSVHFICMII